MSNASATFTEPSTTVCRRRIFPVADVQAHVEPAELVAAHREAGQRIAFSMLRRWNARIDAEEVVSAVDLALTRAARRFRADRGSQFLSFSYFFIKAAVVDEICRRRKKGQEIPCDTILEKSESASESTVSRSRYACPERMMLEDERTKLVAAAIRTLPKVERDIILRTFMEEEEVTSIAKALGYSRGHVSRMKQRALSKIRVRIEAKAA